MVGMIINPYRYAAPSSIPAPASDWRFNDGSGTNIADNKSVSALTATGTPTWGSGYMQHDSGNNANTFSAANGTYGSPTDFTCVLWIDTQKTGDATSNDLWSISNGSSSSVANYGCVLRFSNVGTIFAVSDGVSTATTASATTVLQTGTVYMIMCTYTRVGGASNNIQSTHVTPNGTFEKVTNSSGLLFNQNAAFEMRMKRASGASPASRYYRLSFWNSVLSDSVRDAIWSAGSESTSY